jgi:hypothetical protein
MKFTQKLLLIGALTAGAFGCGAPKDEDADQHGEILLSPACQQLSELCHIADTGAGPAHECHAIAHEDVQADCVAAEDDCLAACAP